MREALALLVLVAVLLAAVLRPRGAPDWVLGGGRRPAAHRVRVIEFVRLGGLTVQLGLAAGTVALWGALHVF